VMLANHIPEKELPVGLSTARNPDRKQER
jgi:hypothetical protein